MDVTWSTSWALLVLPISAYLLRPLLLQPWRTAAGVSTLDSQTSWLKRMDDARWWMQMALPAIMIHQFEEYGVDLKGRHFYFHQIICGKLGYTSTADCTIQAWHLTFINLVLMTWAALRARSAPAGPGANFVGLAAFNALVHIVPGAIDAAHGGKLYNPGQLSALVLLIPGAVGALRALYRQRVITGAGIARALAVGMLAHVIHFFGHYLRSREIINDVIWIPYLIADFIGFMSLACP